MLREKVGQSDAKINNNYEDASGKHRIITISAESVATLAKVSMAIALSGADKKLGNNWLNTYLLYIRRVPDGATIVDPLKASGYIDNQGEVDVGDRMDQGTANEMVSLAENNKDSMLTFIIAHEIGHIVLKHNLKQAPDESNEHFFARSRANESKADQFAMLVAVRLDRRTEGAPLKINGAC